MALALLCGLAIAQDILLYGTNNKAIDIYSSTFLPLAANSCLSFCLCFTVGVVLTFATQVTRALMRAIRTVTLMLISGIPNS